MPHITTCQRCGNLYEESSEEFANSPLRRCASCSNFEWLTTCPSNDINFKHALLRADVATIEHAIEMLTGLTHSKTRLRALESRRRTASWSPRH